MSRTRMISAKLESVDSPVALPLEWIEDPAEYVREPLSSMLFSLFRDAELLRLPLPLLLYPRR